MNLFVHIVYTQKFFNKKIQTNSLKVDSTVFQDRI